MLSIYGAIALIISVIGSGLSLHGWDYPRLSMVPRVLFGILVKILSVITKRSADEVLHKVYLNIFNASGSVDRSRGIFSDLDLVLSYVNRKILVATNSTEISMDMRFARLFWVWGVAGSILFIILGFFVKR